MSTQISSVYFSEVVLSRNVLICDSLHIDHATTTKQVRKALRLLRQVFIACVALSTKYKTIRICMWLLCMW
eukprot:m.1554075 g.1554075  ORF g.1554075 m.1554075 type:complete len:71 (+) comp25270_c1_seq27:5736-5948(+)